MKTQLAKLVPQLKDLGSCNDHPISNSAKHGYEAFDTDVKEVLVNLYFDIGGAKGKGLKKMRDFETIAKKAKNKSVTKKLRKFGATRFRSYRICIAPVISNWDSIVEYYDSVKKLTNRQSKLKPFFVDQEFASLLKLEFIMAATQDLNSAINFVEERRNKIHVVREKMEDILMCHLTKFVKSNFVKNIASNGDVSKKTGAELLEIDVTNSDLILGKKSVFIGQKCVDLIKSLDLIPNSPHLDFFYEKVYNFYKVSTSKLQEYFVNGLSSLELEYMAALSPERRNKEDTPKKIMHLAHSYSKIVDGIARGWLRSVKSRTRTLSGR